MIEGLPLVGLSAPALLGVAVMMLLLGRIVPRATLQEAKDEATRWREAYEAERESRANCEYNTKELLELAKTSHAVLVAMFDTVGHTKGDKT